MTPREEYAAHLQTSYDATVPNGGNRAILNHLNKVRAMTDAEFVEHKKKLDASAAAFVASGTASKLAGELFAKMKH